MGRRDKSQNGQSLAELAIFLPIIIVLLLAVGDLARVFATMISIESGARQAADWGAYRPGNWDSVSTGSCGDTTYMCSVAEMKRRACTAALGMPEYEGDASGSDCTNPAFECAIGIADDPTTSCSSANTCDVDPCRLKVMLTYRFDLLAPSEFLALPSSFTFTRSSVFAIGKDPTGTP